MQDSEYIQFRFTDFFSPLFVLKYIKHLVFYEISPAITEKNKYATFFDLSNFTGGFKALFKKRHNNKRR